MCARREAGTLAAHLREYEIHFRFRERGQSFDGSQIEATGGELVEQFLERRTFLKAAFSIAAGVAAFAASVQAAPLMPPPVDSLKGKTPVPEPAVADQADLDNAHVEEVRWGWHRRHWRRWHRRRYWGWRRRRYWGWRRRRYYYGFRRRRWQRRWYRRRYW